MFVDFFSLERILELEIKILQNPSQKTIAIKISYKSQTHVIPEKKESLLKYNTANIMRPKTAVIISLLQDLFFCAILEWEKKFYFVIYTFS